MEGGLEVFLAILGVKAGRKQVQKTKTGKTD